MSACKNEPKEISVLWSDNNKATGVFIPAKMTGDIEKDHISRDIKIRLLNSKNPIDILGDYEVDGDFIIFHPVLPFTWANEYAVFVKGKQAGSFRIDAAYRNDPSLVEAVYPQTDSVPDNLLKIYIQFSHPMREGESAKYIKLVKNNKDTLPDVFLDLQPELWNEDRTVFTAWLDPGRIKRDLQPNLRLGAPLHQKEKYELVVLKGWKDIEGKTLIKDYKWSFVTRQRDSLSPDPQKWTLLFVNDTKKKLLVAFHETLDHFLVMESLHVTDINGFAVKGSWQWSDNGGDSICLFTPTKPWERGDYILRIDSKLEDLAGNNLNRPFDRDITKTKQPSEKAFYTREFNVQ